MRALFVLITFSLFGNVELGIERFVKEGKTRKYATKSIGLITNHTGLDASGKATAQILREGGPYH